MKACANYLLLIIGLLLQQAAFAFPAEVVRVLDRDTIDVLHDGNPERIRLNGIDCPEKKQAFGQKAKEATSKLCFGKVVEVDKHGQDRYGRSIGEITLNDGTVVNQELVATGMAWW